MCGIIAVLRRPVERTDLPAEPLFGALERGVQALHRAIDDPGTSGRAIDALADVAVDLDQVDADLHGPRGARPMLGGAAASSRIRWQANTLVRSGHALDAALHTCIS